MGAIRRAASAFLLTAIAVIGVLSLAPAALAVGGTCDPATRGDVFNQQDLVKANGTVMVTVRYGWDGISVRPDCDGPLVNGTGTGNVWAIKVTNNDTVSWWVNTVGRRGQPRHLQLLPGTTTKYTAAQAASGGYSTNLDIAELTLDPAST